MYKADFESAFLFPLLRSKEEMDGKENPGPEQKVAQDRRHPGGRSGVGSVALPESITWPCFVRRERGEPGGSSLAWRCPSKELSGADCPAHTASSPSADPQPRLSAGLPEGVRLFRGMGSGRASRAVRPSVQR